MSMDFYDMDGKQISMDEFGSLMSDPSKRRIAETTLPGGVWVSTVLLGMDHSFGFGGRPVIFETMVFPSASNMSELDMERYCTKEEAQAGHDAMVTKWSGWTDGDDFPERG